MIDVPSSAKLKESSGDRRPYLQPQEKLRHALFVHEPPFDGVCHHCATAKATYHTPITVSVLAERATVKSGGVTPTITGGIAIRTPAYEETWEQLTFPLLLCDHCQSKCVGQRTADSGQWGFVAIGAVLAFAGLPLITLHVLIGVFSLLFAVAFFVAGIWTMLPPPDQRGDQQIRSWISRIRWVPELINSGGEIAINVGRSEPLHT